jgi:hypothetical protein
MGLDRRMIEEVRDERFGELTMYQTTNYNVHCYLNKITISNGRDVKRIEMDRALKGCCDLKVMLLKPFVRQAREWDEIVRLAKDGTLARRRLLLAVLDE